jgi:hypothetical protein
VVQLIKDGKITSETGAGIAGGVEGAGGAAPAGPEEGQGRARRRQLAGGVRLGGRAGGRSGVWLWPGFG